MSGDLIHQLIESIADAISQRIVATQRAEAERQKVVYLTPAQMAERLQVSVKTLANLRSSRKGPQFIKAGNRVRYPVTEGR